MKIRTTTGESVAIKTLETKDRGRPLLLGKELDAAVQEFVNNLRAANGVVNRVVVMNAAEGIVYHRDVSKYLTVGIPYNANRSRWKTFAD